MDDAVWAGVDDQRSRVVALLESLTPGEWESPSLCTGWRVRDVAAHLTLQQVTLGQALLLFLRTPGGVNHVIQRSAVRKASRVTSDDLIAEIRSTIGSRRTNVGIPPVGALSDIVLHGQDIAVPLGHRIQVDAEIAMAVLDFLWALLAAGKAGVYAPSPREGVRFVAVDADWAAGEGAAAHAPALSIAMILTGRSIGLGQAAGPGAELMRRRITGLA